ncbi:MAG: methylamine utilization protein [Deltaproteobacteria bacterium]|nr:methylamine utilization protein [Deltaproteobacteria bacterium]
MLNKTGIILLAALAAALSSPAFAGSIEFSVNDGKSNPVADAVVYAVPRDGAPSFASRKAVIDQIDKEFVGYVTAIEKGTAVNFPNHDKLRHHVYSFSEAKRFEIPLYTGTPANPVVFDKPGVVALGCNIHDWMSAYVFVSDTPHFSTASENGRGRIENIPAGEYDVSVWHPRLKASAKPAPVRVRVADDGASKADFQVALQNVWRAWRAPVASGNGYR